MKKHMNLFIGIFMVALTAVYLYTFFLPGIWHNGAFLYKKGDSFFGSDKYADYVLSVKRNSDGAKIEFSLNGEKHRYEVTDFEKPRAEIYEDGKIIFSGKVLDIDGTYILMDDDGIADGADIVIGDEPQKEDLMPSPDEIYKWSKGKTDFRGNPYPAIFLVFAGLFLFLDIKFPNLFFYLRHGLAVDGGEPSDWYLFCQQLGRILLGITVLVCVILTFTAH